MRGTGTRLSRKARGDGTSETQKTHDEAPRAPRYRRSALRTRCTAPA